MDGGDGRSGTRGLRPQEITWPDKELSWIYLESRTPQTSVRARLMAHPAAELHFLVLVSDYAL